MQQKSKKASKAKSSASNLRTPIVVVMGHVDHGKTALLDKIRGTAVAKGEAGQITQHIGATEVPLGVVQEFCGSHFGAEFQVPGLLFIDTPGHHAFTSMRSRGGSLADLAVLIVDINEGFQPQTIESLNILKRFKTPFVVAANKIEPHRWMAFPSQCPLCQDPEEAEREGGGRAGHPCVRAGGGALQIWI